MGLTARVGKSMDKLYLRMRHPIAFEVTGGEQHSFDTLRGRKYALLVTFRGDGRAVPTPTWFGVGGDGNVYKQTFADAGKVKRLRNDPRALVCPCTVRGKTLGMAITGRARILPPEEWEYAERAIQSNHGLGRRIYMLPSRNDTDSITSSTSSRSAAVGSATWPAKHPCCCLAASIDAEAAGRVAPQGHGPV